MTHKNVAIGTEAPMKTRPRWFIDVEFPADPGNSIPYSIIETNEIRLDCRFGDRSIFSNLLKLSDKLEHVRFGTGLSDQSFT